MKILFKFIYCELKWLFFSELRRKFLKRTTPRQQKSNSIRNKKAKQNAWLFFLALMTYQFAKRTLTAFNPFFPSLSSKVTASFSWI